MELNAHKDTFSVCETAFQGSVEHPIDYDITLPEYLPDIVRVLRCTATPGVQSHQITGDRITAECDCLVRVLYVCEQGKIRCFEQTLHFGKQLELRSTDNITDIFVGAKTDYVNYRVSGIRKLEIHGCVSVFARAFTAKEHEYISDASGDGITARCEKQDVCDLISLTEKAFSVSETCETTSPSSSVDSIVSSCACAVIDELKIISDKFFLKGEMIVHITYSSGDDCEIYTFDTSVGLNEIIEVPLIDEGAVVDASLSVIGLDVRPKFDAVGNKSLIDISATLNLSAFGYKNRTVTVIKDAYSTKYESELKKSNIYVHSLEDTLDDVFLCRGTAELKTTGVSKVLSFLCGDITAAFSLREDGIAVNGEITADIIYEDSKGDVCFAQRQIPYEYSRPIISSNAVLTCRPVCNITAFSFVMGEADTLDVRAEINIHGFIFREEEKIITNDIVIHTDRAKTVNAAALTVYFADCGESIWDIAEKFNTTVDAVLRENHISDGVLDKKCKLLIPKI